MDKNERQIDSFTNAVKVFTKDISMRFGIDKCLVFAIKMVKEA